MDRRIIWAVGVSLAMVASVSAQQPGFYPAAPGPVMSLPSSALFPDPAMPPQGPGSMYPDKPPRYPVDENGNRAVNWFYSQTELLYGWVNKGDNQRPVGTRGSTLGGGIIGEPGTSSLGTVDNFGAANGVRQTIGIWLNPARSLGVEFGGYVLERRTDGFSARSDDAGNPILARPFYDSTIDVENARFVSFPNGFTGQIDAVGRSRNYGAEINFIWNMIERDSFSVDLVNGFRFLALEESLTVTDRSQAIGAGLLPYNGILAGPPAAIQVFDRAATANRFYGYSFGLRASGEYSRISYALTGRIALGAVRQRQFGEGSTSFFPDGTTLGASTPVGMNFFSSNSGLANKTKFAVVPELGLKLGYRLTHHISTYIGYDVIYLSEAVRPTDSWSRSINPTLLPTSPNFGTPFGPAGPTGGIKSADFLLQTFSSGVMVVF